MTHLAWQKQEKQFKKVKIPLIVTVLLDIADIPQLFIYVVKSLSTVVPATCTTALEEIVVTQVNALLTFVAE